MHNKIIQRLEARFSAYADLADLLDDELLGLKIDVPKHKSLAEHLWCVIGGRESYARALTEGQWQGFACSMQSFNTTDFQSKLATSSHAVMESLDGINDWTMERDDLLAKLSEHEVMHEGQIIRHMYALERELPESWEWA